MWLLWLAWIALALAWHAQTTLINALNVVLETCCIFMKTNAWLIAQTDMSRIPQLTSAKSVWTIAKLVNSPTQPAPHVIQTRNLNTSINRTASNNVPPTWVCHFRTFSVEIATPVVKPAQSSRTSAHLACLTWGLTQSNSPVPRCAKKVFKFMIRIREFALTVIHPVTLVLVILRPVHHAGLARSLIRIILAGQVACMTIKSLCLVYAELANFHVLSAREIWRDALNAKEITCFIMQHVYNIAHLNTRQIMIPNNAFTKD